MNKDLKHIKDQGFKVPKDYFETLEDSIMSNISLDNQVSKIKSSGFKTPKNYFDTIEDDIFSKLETPKETQVIPLFGKRNILYFSSIAAVLLLMLAIFVNTNSEELDYEIVEDYIVNEDIDVYELASLLTDEEFNSIEMEIMNSTYNDEDMESYLLDNVNLEDLIEQ